MLQISGSGAITDGFGTGYGSRNSQCLTLMKGKKWAILQDTTINSNKNDKWVWEIDNKK